MASREHENALSGGDTDSIASMESSSALSPTDGYFRPSTLPQQVFHETSARLPDDSNANAAPQQSTSYVAAYYLPKEPEQPSPNSNHRRSRSDRSNHLDEATPLLGEQYRDVEDPPPAYEESTASPYSGTRTATTNYGSNSETIEPTPQSPELYSTLEPAIIGGHAGRYNEEPARPNGYIRRSNRRRPAGCCCRIALIVPLLFIFLSILDALTPESGDGYRNPWQDIDLGTWPKECSLRSTSGALIEMDDGDKFSLSEDVTTSKHPHFDSMYGRVYLTTGLDSQASPILVNLSISTSSEYDVSYVRFIKTASHLQILPPVLKPNGRDPSSPSPCMEIDVYVTIRPGVQLANLSIDLHRLDLLIGASSAIEVTELAKIGLTSGSLESVLPLNSRETKIRVGTGSVNGKYTLMDLLDIETTTGSVNIEVEPKDADEHKNPASFKAFSRTGSIHVEYPKTGWSERSLSMSAVSALHIPNRDYAVNVHSNVGSISGYYFFGSTARFTTQSGSISTTLLPVLPPSSQAHEADMELKTWTKSGHQNAHLANPIALSSNGEHSPVEKWRNIRSKHETLTGSISLHYPSSWEGTLKATTTFGSVQVLGDGIRIIDQEDGIGHHKVKAVKGISQDSEGSYLKAHATTGSVNVEIGD
ncbi:hypothetical protein P152DRAFT_446195 [Eremomyces bilateralis CBS 781.70]|uniref:Adhesin domain-containing protein n=1 Tax=Eremomyces bilateralis CBS 781.70 TaxID=1392243 RepID=A0A6G1GES1_9PEZI|nr:uncharacterized protein P152DRAFT_446195 [Eremomyces bilateralis CBS 781.70]KAF1816553.1 hypothetical protein P152DRAFT_446195 [Eremomyces bilateralis CBS 781.70]